MAHLQAVRDQRRQEAQVCVTAARTPSRAPDGLATPHHKPHTRRACVARPKFGRLEELFRLKAWQQFDFVLSLQQFYFACLALIPYRIEHVHEGVLTALGLVMNFGWIFGVWLAVHYGVDFPCRKRWRTFVNVCTCGQFRLFSPLPTLANFSGRWCGF